VTSTAVVEVWSDIACPWCYIGKSRFTKALESFPDRDRIEVIWRAYQLSPETPVGEGTPEVESLMATKGLQREQVLQMFDQVRSNAESTGLEIDFDNVVAANTFDAHRLIQMAGPQETPKGPRASRRNEVMDNLFRAHFVEGRIIDDLDVLAAVADESGLGADIRSRLDTDEGAEEVRADLATAKQIGVSGVPFFVAGRRVAVSGAQPEEVFFQLFDRAVADLD
jgi:predicted DsbA family dithiol-disulfide isomerase